MAKRTAARGTAARQAGVVPARKLFAPLQSRRVERVSILQRVFGEHAPAVVVLQAPAGHGKSMALGQIKQACETRGMLCAWLNLDESDNDSRRHASHLRALVMQLGGKRARGNPPTGSASRGQARRPPQRADWLIDELVVFDKQTAIFIDEFEVLSDRSVLTFWRDFLLRAPPSVRVFIGTRATPELGLTRLLVGNRLLMLSADDLRFSRDETQAFFALHSDLMLHPAEIDSIFRRSEGWPAAVQLFRLGLLNPDTRRTLRDIDQSRPRELAEYLIECVLVGQPENVRDFLLRTSILRRLNVELCAAVTGRRDAQELLLRLEREGLFVRALDSTGQWFRYHPLFASLLLDQLTQSEPACVAELHRAAQRWWQKSGQYEEAMHHAVAAGDLTLACDMFRDWSARLVASGEMATVSRWLDRLPLQQIDADLPLTVRVVWALTFLHQPLRLERHLSALERLRSVAAPTGRGDESTTIRAIASMCADRIDEAAQIMSTLPSASGMTDGFDAFDQAAGENMRAYLCLFSGELSAAHAHLARARSLSQIGDAPFTLGYAACFEGSLLILEGRVNTALACLRSGIDHQRSVLDSSFVTAPLVSCYLWALYESDDLDLLEAVADEYRDMLPDTPVPDYFAVGQICLARAHLARGRMDDAVLVLERAQFIAARNGWPRIEAMVQVEKNSLRGRLPDGAAHARRRPLESEYDRTLLKGAMPPAGWTSPATEMTASTRFMLTAGEGAAMEVAREPAAAIPYRHLGAQIRKALREHLTGKRLTALRHARQALITAARTGLIRPMSDHGPEMTGLLVELLTTDPSFAETPAGQLATAVVARTQGGPTTTGTREPPLRFSSFTNREREILGCLAKRLSNKEIAKRTLMSTNTVKFHLKNIYAKLDVSTRIEAYAAVVRLGHDSLQT